MNDRPILLIVDDSPDNLTLMSEVLKEYYRVKVANNGGRALKIALSRPAPDLILLDVVMPDIDGYEVCRQLKADPRSREIPVLFLTGRGSADDEALGLSLGAVDYISKPANPAIVLARVKTHLELKMARDFLQDQNSFLEAEVRRRTQEVNTVQEVTIQALASLAETRDLDTGNHIRRTKHYVRALANKLRKHPRFAHFLDNDETIDILYKSAPLHDIGKVGIPDRILLKPGRYEPEEFEIMKGHSNLGYQALRQAERELGQELPFLRHAKDIVLYHHEKWDGGGYPKGLAGDDIPISARLMAVADVYDALISRRVYKEGMPHQRAVKILLEGRGQHFDSDILDAFLDIQGEFQEIAKRYADTDQELADKTSQLSRLES